jgi:hypothetical protein
MDGMAPADGDFLSVDATLAASPRQADGSMDIPTLMCLAQDSKFINAGEVIAGYTDFVGDKPDLGWREFDGTAPSAIARNLVDLKGARRLNIYNQRGALVGMVSDGNIDALNLQPGIYIVQDFDNNKSVKIRR